jgi:hypothetical protein
MEKCSTNKYGNYCLSKLKNSRATRFNPPSTNTKIDHSNDIPGPGV